MATTFFDANGNYYETLTDRETPQGHSIAPQKPSRYHEWDGQQWVDNSPSASEVLAERREAASLDRMTFALRAAQAGFVTYDDAAQWAAGNSLPTQVQAMIDALPEAQRGPALVKVLGARNVNRNDELMPGIIAAFQTNDAGADALFGIS